MPKASPVTRLLGALAASMMLLGPLAVGVAGESLGANWSSNANYPGTTVELQSCVTNTDFGRIYCVGGYGGSAGSGYLSTVEYSSDASLGQIAGWTSTTAYPKNTAGQSCFAFAVYIFCVGGYAGGTRTDSVYYAQPTGSGLGPWSSTTSYPFTVQLQSCAVSGSFVYCVGGFDGIRYYNSTYFAQLSSSGGLGAWSTTTQYPTPIEGQSCFVYSTYIYCIGGYNGSTGTKSVYYAPLLASGGIGRWNSTTPYPVGTYGQSCPVQSNYVYCVGGYDGAHYSNGVYYASILSSGGIGSWTSTSPYPTGIQNESCVTYGSYIYCIGGFTGSQVTNSVYSDSISALAPTTVTSTATTTTTVTSILTNYTTINRTVSTTLTSTVTTTTPVVLTTASTKTAVSFSATTATVTSTTTVLSGATATVTITTPVVSEPSQNSVFVLVGAGLAGVVLGAVILLGVLRSRRPSEKAEEVETV